ncbi:hypothetical protein BG418_34330 [Streptomyces sp. CBMA152]|nr:hypothetical protein [Streptomyces sp. CBMA152]
MATPPTTPYTPITATGPVDVEAGPLGLVVLNGGGETIAYRAKLGRGGNRLGTLYKVSGKRVLGDLVRYESDNEPDWVLGHEPTAEEPLKFHSNAWKFTRTRSGGWLVADAAANDVVRISPSGRAGLATLLPDNTANGERADGVAGGVVEAPDGTVYIADMGNLKPGISRIWKMRPGHHPELLVDGLNAIDDLALDSKGNLVALSLAGGFQKQGPPKPGAVLRVDVRTKKVTEIPTGGKLAMPTGRTGPAEYGAADQGPRPVSAAPLGCAAAVRSAGTACPFEAWCHPARR